MPPPSGKPYTLFGGAGLSAPEIGLVDPDYQYFLDYVRLDGKAYALYIPSKDGVSPPEVIRYEEHLFDSNVGAPVAGSDGGGQGSPPPLEEDSYGGAAPPRAGVKRKAPHGSPRAEARRGTVPVGEDPPAQVPEPAWYESPDMDEDYRLVLRHVRVENDGKMVLKMGNSTVHFGYEPSVDNRYAEEEDDAEEEDEDELIPASGQSGEDVVGTGEKKKVKADKEAGLDSELQIVNKIDVEVKEEKVSEEEEEEGNDKDTEEEEVDEDDVGWKAEEEVDSEVGPGSELQIVNFMEFETKEEMEEEREKLLNMEASSSKGHPTIPRNDSGLQGVVWPPHISERPDSDFKDKLMKILIKPFKKEEYDRYVTLATKRSPVVKERRTRHNVVYYPWKHEMGKSYFDSYPDLAEQFKLQENNYLNRLALLRGFFFWLQNIGQEDQFRPWRSDFKTYRCRVVSIP